MNDKTTNRQNAARRYSEQQMEMLLNLQDMLKDEVQQMVREEVHKLTDRQHINNNV